MSKRKPSYLLHKSTGQARVRIDGKDHYLGEYGSPESRERYDDLVAEWFRNNLEASRSSLTIDELALLFLNHAESYYRKNGKTTSEVQNIRIALRPLIQRFGACRVRDFGPVKLKTVREAMIRAGSVRTSINRQVDRIKRMFRWGVENEHVPAEVFTALATVTGLRAGRSPATESKPVQPVPLPAIDAIQPYLSRQIWAMVQLQLLTGMRPGEVLQMRGRDINRELDVWEYHPESHKTEHHGRRRTIFLGPKAQQILWQFLQADPQRFLFSPIEAKSEFHAMRSAARKTPLTPSQRARKPLANPKRSPGECYTTTSYRRAVAEACKKAGVEAWSPGRLRHNAATNLRRVAGIDAARTVLGHAAMQVTEVYAERDEHTAREVISKIG